MRAVAEATGSAVTVALSTFSGSESRTGRGRPACAVRAARWVSSAIRSGSLTSSAHFVIGRKKLTRSISSNASRCAIASETCPTTASSGIDSAQALCTPIARFAAPGPREASATASRSDARQ